MTQRFEEIPCKFCRGRGYSYEGFDRLPCLVCKGARRLEISLEADEALGKCLFCAGRGYVYEGLDEELCPSCHGTAVLKYKLDPNRNLGKCGFCAGRGYVWEGLDKQLCPTCKGLGLTYPKRVADQGPRTPKVVRRDPPAAAGKFQYDIAVSFAGEDRQVVAPYVEKLKSLGFNVFYDEHSRANLWGEDLYTKLHDVYEKQARYCVLFISRHYERKLWTNHERKAAQARAFKESHAYILPVKLDDTELPGLSETVHYEDLRHTTIAKLVQLTVQKLRA